YTTLFRSISRFIAILFILIVISPVVRLSKNFNGNFAKCSIKSVDKLLLTFACNFISKYLRTKTKILNMRRDVIIPNPNRDNILKELLFKIELSSIYLIKKEANRITPCVKIEKMRIADTRTQFSKI